MANVQETVAGPSVMYMTLRVETLLNDKIMSQDSAMEVQKRANVGVLERADELQVSTIRNGVGMRVERLLDGEITSQDSAMKALKRANVGVLERADELRVSTVRNRVGILSPPQMVQFLTAVVQFQLHVRRWGLQSDAQRQRCVRWSKNFPTYTNFVLQK